MWIKVTCSCGICKQIPSRSLVLLGAWIRRKEVRNFFSQTWWVLGSNGRRNDGKFLSIQSSDISCLQSLWERKITKQRREKEVDTLRWELWTIELLLRTVISANQLSINGAIADSCDEVPKHVRAPEKPAAPQHLEEVEIPTVLSKAENSTSA